MTSTSLSSSAKTNVRFIPAWIATGLFLVLALACGGGGGGSSSGPLPAPVLVAVVPAQGQAGDEVRLTGHHFTGVPQVTFGNVTAVGARVVAPTELRVTVPAGAATGLVRVATPAGRTDPGVLFTVVAPGPTLDAVQPDRGGPGDPIVLTGTRLGEATEVRFHRQATRSFTAEAGGTRLRVTVPDGAASGPIQVVTPQGSTGTGAIFTVLPRRPAITGIQPAQAAPGAEIVLAGTGLSQVTEVLFNGIPADQFSLTPDGAALRVVVPALAGSGEIRVQDSNGRAAEAPARLTVLPPVVPVILPTVLPTVPPTRTPVVVPPAGPSTTPPTAPPAGPSATPTADPAAPPAALAAAMRQAREAGANIPAAQAAHEAAVATLMDNLFAQRQFEYGLFTRGTINLTTAWQEAKDETARIARQPRGAGEYRINYEYIDADPYLATHTFDIDLLMPAAVTDAEFTAIFNALKATGQVQDTVLDGIAGRIEHASAPIKSRLRKRVKRLFDEVQLRASRGEQAQNLPGLTPMAEFTLEMGQQEGRCPDGISNGLTTIENRVFPGNGGGGAIHLGAFMSSVFTDHKMAFIRKHAGFYPDYAEFVTSIVETLNVRMLYAMGLRGSFAPILYPEMGIHTDEQRRFFGPAAVIRRFLLGERGAVMPGHSTPVDFEPFDVECMVRLLQEARERSIASASGTRAASAGNPASLVPNALITAELVDPANYNPRDPVLGPKLAEFEVVNMGTDANEYFLPAPAGESSGNYRLTREFWLHMLRKYNYILP